MTLEKDILSVREQTKQRIKGIVDYYKRLFPGEYWAVVKQVKMNRDNQQNKFGAIKGNEFVERALVETPETLNSMFDLRLADDEKLEFKSKKGMQWFANAYSEFRLAEKI